jgi:RimJ/RimL family protein N-acetyltransferase
MNDTNKPGLHVLRIEPATAEQLSALIAGTDRFVGKYGITVVDGYLEFPEALTVSLDGIQAGLDERWATHLFIHTEDRALIGLGGYKGPPTDGVVEIGYGIAPAYRGRGYATEAARVFVDRARSAGVTTVIAHTLAEPNASTRVLGHLGFTRTGTVDDPENGAIWRWEKPLTPPD